MDQGKDDTIDKEQLVDKLIELETFSLSREELVSLTQSASIQRYGIGEQFIFVGRECEGLYVVLTGKARKTTYNSQNKEYKMGGAYPGNKIGLVSTIRHDESIINAFAEKDTQVAILKIDAVESVLHSNPQFALSLEQSIENRLKTLRAIRHKGQKRNSSSVDQNENSSDSLKQILRKIGG